jgi:segregation and condensation protein A
MAEYRVRFEVFEGPLDLLLYLIRKEEVDIYEVNLTHIATEFVAYLDIMRELDLDIAGEFLVMAATLMLIKSRELLPRDQRPDDQGAEDDALEDPRWELIRQLVEYKKFKDAASHLTDLELRTANTFARVPGRIEPPEEVAPAGSTATIFDLLGAVNAVLRRFNERTGEQRDVFEDKWTVSEKIESLLTNLRGRGKVRFLELFHAATSRAEVVVTFLALLELMRLRLIQANQTEAFGEITVEEVSSSPEPSQPVPSEPEPGSMTGPPPPEATPPSPQDSGVTRWN